MEDIFTLVNDGYYDKVEQLLLANPDLVFARHAIGDQPLHIACLRKHVGMLGLLFTCGAPVNSRGSGGMTPLHYAVYEGTEISIPIVSVLLAEGADPSIRNDQGWTPADFAKIDMTRGLGEVLAVLERGS